MVLIWEIRCFCDRFLVLKKRNLTLLIMNTFKHARKAVLAVEKVQAKVKQNVSKNWTSAGVKKSSFAAFSSDESLHKNFIEYGRNAKEWLRKCALLLPEIDRQKIWQKKGFSSIFEYAAKLAGMSRSSVEDALRVMKKVEDKPALRKIVEQKGINAVRPVVAIATVETADFWAKKAEIMSKNTLETYVREYKKQFREGENFNRLDGRTGTAAQSEKGANSSATHLGQSAGTKTIIMTLSPEIAAKLEKLKGNGSWDDLMNELLKIREEKLEAEKPQPVETPSRHIPAKVKNFAVAKTRGQCAFPGCTKPYKTLHHTQRFAIDHVHDPDHLVPLCEAHEHLAHHGLIANEDRAPDQWSILLEPTWYDFKQVVDERVQEHRVV